MGPWKRNILIWMVVSTKLKTISQIGSFPQVRVNIIKYLKPPNSLESIIFRYFRFQPFVFWGVSSCKNARTASCLETFCSPRNLIPPVWYFHDLLDYSPGIHRLSMDFPKIISTWHMYTHVIFCSFWISSDFIFGVMWLSRVVSRWTR